MNPPTKMRMDFLIITPKLLDLSYSIYKKTFCEARVNLEVCSHLADEPSLADGPPLIEHRCLEYQYTKLAD